MFPHLDPFTFFSGAFSKHVNAKALLCLATVYGSILDSYIPPLTVAVENQMATDLSVSFPQRIGHFGYPPALIS